MTYTRGEDDLKNVCKFGINSDDIIKKAGLDPDTAVITKMELNDFDGNIIFTIKSAVPVEGVTIESATGNARVNKLELKSDIDMKEFMSKMQNTMTGMGFKLS